MIDFMLDIPPAHIALFTDPSFKRIILHTLSDCKLKAFKKRKYRMRKAK